MEILRNGSGGWAVINGAVSAEFDTEAQARWFALTGETLSAAEAAERLSDMDRDDQYVAEVKAANEAVWNGINKLLALQRQWNALDYGTTLNVTGVVTAEVGAVVFDSANAFLAVLNTGVATNMAKLL